MSFLIYYIFLFIFIFLFILQSFGFIFKKTYSAKKKIFILPLKGHREDIEYIIRKIILKLSFSNVYIICIDLGLDTETKKICELLCKDFNFIYMIEKIKIS